MNVSLGWKRFFGPFFIIDDIILFFIFTGKCNRNIIIEITAFFVQMIKEEI